MDFVKFPHHRGALPHSREGERQARFLETLGVGALHRRNADGSVSRKVGERLYVTPGQLDQRVTKISKLAWVPEGMVITPRSASNPKGWGLPPTPDGGGTPGGDFPYAVINHYQHNNTPEYLHSVYSDTPRIDGQGARMALNWPVNYMQDEASEIGSWQADRFLPQFAARWVPLLKEKKQSEWFCHRPEIRPWPFGMMPAILEGVNAVRASVGRAPVSPPLAGWTPDLAQAITLENVRAKLVDHNSTTFRQGWQQLIQRVEARAGQLVTAGENLYASYGQNTGAALGDEAVAAWTTSPPHYAVMTYDYTDGLRAWRASAGSAQLTGEVMSLGTWPRANLNLPNRAKEQAAVVMAVDGRGPRCTVWRHPQLGSMSVSQPPGSFAAIPTRNYVWAAEDMASYKHTDWVVGVTSEEEFSAHREMALGAALCVVGTTDPVTEDQWGKALAEKTRREARYAARRMASGLPPDNVCVGSEADLSRAQTGDVLKLRALNYEESGPPRMAPDATGTTCKLVMREGAAEDFMATRAIIGSITLPYNPLHIGPVARFSQDGHKAVVTCSEHLSGGAVSTWDGERLHFYEFNDGAASHVGTAEIDIEVFSSSGGYGQTASARCHLYPFYDGNLLRFIDLSVEHLASLDDTGSETAHERSLRASLVMPNGTHWMFTWLDSSGASGASSGYLRHLLYLDPTMPERTHWIEFSMSAGAGTTTVGASIQRNMFAPQTVKTIYSGLSFAAAGAPHPWLVPARSKKTGSTPGAWEQEVCPSWPFAAYPSADFKASFFLGNVGFPAFGNALYGAYQSGVRTFNATPLAPVWWYPSTDFSDTVSDAATEDAYVLAGQFAWTPFGFGKAGAPGGSWQYFKSSSLDLEAITGVAGLSDNILPIWSL